MGATYRGKTAATSRAARPATQPRDAWAGPLRRFGFLLLTMSFIAISWNAVRVNGVEPGQGLLAASVVVLGVDALRTRRLGYVPRGMLVGAALIALAGLLTEVHPPSIGFIGGRFDVSSLGSAYGEIPVTGSNLIQLAKFESALLGVVAAILLLRPSAAETKRLASAWALSAIVSALAAASDATGRTSISTNLLGFIDESGRQAGLSEQPNHLAVALALAVPIVLFWVVHGKPAAKLIGAMAVGVVAYGSLLAGSRGGFAGVVVAAILFVLLAGRIRLRAIVVGVPFLAAGLSLALVISPSIFSTVLTKLRLAGDLGAGSNALHALALQQGLLDVQQSPIFGIGFDHLTEATEVHLQLLAAGGIIALVGYCVYWFSVLRTSHRARLVDAGLASALLASVLTFLILNFAENQVADTYLYVPAALLVGLAALQREAARSPDWSASYASTSRRLSRPATVS